MAMTRTADRNHIIDTIRAILILLVVFGHLLQLYEESVCKDVYRVIYSFHMAFFVLLNGYYARFNILRILKHFIWPYFFFQTAAFCLRYFVLHNNISLQYTTPLFTLWYLLTMAFYYLLIPALRRLQNRKIIFLLLGASFLVSLLIGFIPSVGGFLSLSRTIVFFPFFLLGYYHKILIDPLAAKAAQNRKLLIPFIAVIAAGEIFLVASKVPVSALWFSFGYAETGSLLIRFIAEATAFSWIVLLLVLLPGRKIRFLTEAGKHTMPVYLIHGLLITLIEQSAITGLESGLYLVVSAAIAFGIVFLFGNRHVDKLFRRIF